MAKRPLKTAELQNHLDEQLGFLERSAASFDAGYDDESISFRLHLEPNLDQPADGIAAIMSRNLSGRARSFLYSGHFSATRRGATWIQFAL